MRQMWADNFKPDLIVGLARGGVVPAVQLSHYLDIKMHSLSVSLRDHVDTVSDHALSEMAFNGTNILVIDDINDSGNTFNWVKKDWQSNICPDDSRWQKEIWHRSLKFASLITNESSAFTADYEGSTMNRIDQADIWYVFPWESWW